MLLLDLISKFYEAIDLFDTADAVRTALSSICDHAGLPFFAAVHHADNASSDPDMVFLHNYPADFAAFHADHHLGLRDPVHRACQLRGSGFLWDTLPALLPGLDTDDRLVAERAFAAGIGAGYTTPFHVPGERSGSCSFAVESGRPFPRHLIPLTEALGRFAFEAARTLGRRNGASWLRSGHLTPRERDAVMLLGHGMVEKKIAQMMGVTPQTVHVHLRNARAKFGVSKSAVLVVCALLSGAVTYAELLNG